MKHAPAVLALALGACGGADWIDSPQSCQKVGMFLDALQHDLRQAKHIMTIEEGKAIDKANGDLQEIAKLRLEMAGRSMPGRVVEMRETFEQLVTSAGRETCGNAGKTFAGEWECGPEQQRVKCE